MPPYAFVAWPDGRAALEQEALACDVLATMRLELLRLQQGGPNAAQ